MKLLDMDKKYIKKPCTFDAWLFLNFSISHSLTVFEFYGKASAGSGYPLPEVFTVSREPFVHCRRNHATVAYDDGNCVQAVVVVGKFFHAVEAGKFFESFVNAGIKASDGVSAGIGKASVTVSHPFVMFRFMHKLFVGSAFPATEIHFAQKGDFSVRNIAVKHVERLVGAEHS